MKSDIREEKFLERVMDDQKIIHKVCGMYCDNEEDRKDLFQEMLVNLWKSYPSFRGDAKFTTWMYRVCLNVAFQQLRKRDKSREYTTSPGDFDRMRMPGKEELPENELNLLYKAIAQLSEIEKAIVMLYLEAKGNEEISEIIGISQNNVRVRMTRIRKKLKKIVEE
ncbi:MAG: sigma-70 family RNA polymerase sigma factor [Balneolaceae bacterium]|nr:sigma-70 family RNA polymerase sigma factor [Balneolaceae bacterium]